MYFENFHKFSLKTYLETRFSLKQVRVWRTIPILSMFLFCNWSTVLAEGPGKANLYFSFSREPLKCQQIL